MRRRVGQGRREVRARAGFRSARRPRCGDPRYPRPGRQRGGVLRCRCHHPPRPRWSRRPRRPRSNPSRRAGNPIDRCPRPRGTAGHPDPTRWLDTGWYLDTRSVLCRQRSRSRGFALGTRPQRERRMTPQQPRHHAARQIGEHCSFQPPLLTCHDISIDSRQLMNRHYA